MEDATKYIEAIKRLLIKKGRNDIAQLLVGARCLLENIDGNYSLLSIYFHPQNFDKLTHDMELEMSGVLELAIPRDKRERNISGEYGINYDEVPDIEAINWLMPNGMRIKPVFGEPSTEDKYQCDVFVIMPFKEELKPVYDGIIKPVIENMGYSIKRADETYTDRESMHKIWSMFNACKLVIADCTGHNPNVFYELGIAHTIGKPTVVITQNQELPFDIRTKDALLYSTNFDKTENFKNKLKKAIQDMLGSKPVIDEIPF
ncbi:MAG: hypothetical protein SH821_04815 [Phototrophicales bacterium]|nr:hypothetical protein [Phototrophicales bacterium]